MPRPFPLHLPPMPDEALDSWLLAYAQHMSASVRDLLEHVFSGEIRLPRTHKYLALGAGSLPLSDLSLAAGLEVGALQALAAPLQRYHRSTEPLLRKPFGEFARVTPFSRYCPRCLTDTGGRWMTSWRVAWATTCPQHHLLLVTICPVCGRTQRRGRLGAGYLAVDPTRCTNAALGARGREPARCAADLTNAPLTPAPAGLEALTARLLPLLDPTITDEHLHHLLGVLNDYIRLLGAPPWQNPQQRDTVITDATALAELVEPLATAGERPAPQCSGAAPPRSADPTGPGGYQANPILVGAHRLDATGRLRWRTSTTPRSPTAGTEDVRTLAARTPSALWPEWTVRLRPWPPIQPAQAKPAALLALLIAGSTCTPGAAAALTGYLDDRAATTLVRLRDHDDAGERLAAGLLHLASWLGANGTPIDYDRRRRIATTDLLTQAQWTQHCRQLGRREPGTADLRHARLWLWQLLTGGTVPQAPRDLLTSDGRAKGYLAFATTLSSSDLRALRARATQVLADAGASAEPVRWSPPATAVPRPLWTGTDPAEIDARAIRAQLADKAGARDVSRSLALCPEDLSLLTFTTGQDFSRPRGTRSRRKVPATVLKQLVEQDHLTLHEAAARLGVSPSVIKRRCAEYQITVPGPGRPSRHAVDPDWLRQRYIEDRKAMPEIAAELGIPTTSLNRIAKATGLRLRPRGGASHRRTPRDDYPNLLRRVTEGEGGDRRVSRFQVIIASRSIKEAAKLLRLSPATLHAQLALLERDAGGQLLVRRPGTSSPHQPTRLGKALLDEAEKHLSRLSS